MKDTNVLLGLILLVLCVFLAVYIGFLTVLKVIGILLFVRVSWFLFFTIPSKGADAFFSFLGVKGTLILLGTPLLALLGLGAIVQLGITNPINVFIGFCLVAVGVYLLMPEEVKSTTDTETLSS